MSDVSIDSVENHVAVVSLRRPPHNFFDTALLVALADAYEELAGQRDCRVIVVRAEGKNFCAGLDFANNRDQDIAALYRNAVRLFAAPLPVVAAVQGAAIGGGLGLALSADFRVATPQSRFSANFSRLGFHHGFGLTVTLPRVVGEQRAADLLYSGRRVDGVEAKALGLCDELVAEADLMPAALALALSYAGSGPLAVRAIRATLRQGLVDRLRLAMDHEGDEQETLRGTRDFAEGIRASAERREPRFTGE
jgi:2-(1,2-epoxy-1,2-dihydrophenyl)acetyl-CoA isomerase